MVYTRCIRLTCHLTNEENPMAMNANDQVRLKAIKSELYTVCTALNSMAPKVLAVLDKSNVDSLSKAKSKAKSNDKPEDMHIIDQHQYAIKTLQPHLALLFKEMFLIQQSNDLVEKYASLRDLAKAHRKAFESGDFLKGHEPQITKTLSPEGKFFYALRGDYPNASMNVIAKHLPEVCQSYTKIKSAGLAP